MANRGRLEWDQRELANRLRNMPQRVERALFAIMRFEAPRAERYMKTSAPWNDQTGNARNGLTARGFKDGTNYGIDLAHAVPYGIWLEVRWSGRLAVIQPTIQHQGPEVMQTVAGLFARL